MPNQSRKRERLIMPPQFVASPSEARGIQGPRISLALVFAVVTFLCVLPLALAGFVALRWANVPVSIPALAPGVLIFGAAAWTLILAFLRYIDVTERICPRGRHTPGTIATPWFFALVGVFFLICGIAFTLYSR